MHYLLVTKGNMYIKRGEPRYNLEKKDATGEMKDGVGTVTGLVTATSYDKFFLTLPDGRIQTMLLGELAVPQVGIKLTVTYAGGDPPKALMVEEVKVKRQSKPQI